MVTKEEIIARAGQLQKQAERLKSDLDATLGALQDCGYWLSQLEKQEHGNDLPAAP